MAITFPETLKRGQNPMLGLVAKTIAVSDALGAVIPIEPVAGTSIKVPREGAQPSTTFIPDSGATSEESTAGDDVPEVQFRRIVGNMDIDNLAREVGGTHSGNLEFQTAAKAKATWQKIKEKLITGSRVTSHTLGAGAPASSGAISAIDYGPYLDSTRRGPGAIRYTHAGTQWQFRAPGDLAFGDPVTVASNGTVTLRSYNRSFYITVTIVAATAVANFETSIYFTSSNDEFDGLYEQIDPARLIDPVAGTGDNFSLRLLDKLITNQKVEANRYFMMDSIMLENYYAEMRALGGTDPRTVQLPGYGVTGLGEVPTYRGIPILVNDNMPLETVGGNTDCSSLVLVSLSFEEGLFLAAASSGGEAGVLTPDADPRTRPVLGFRISDIRDLEDKDAMRRRVRWAGAAVLRSTLACARKRGVRHVAA